MVRRCWKHSRQKTGRPCVGRKGTVVSLPHCEQFVLVSARIWPPPPPPSARFALQFLHRLGSFLNPLSAKNICSPAVKTNSAPHSLHFRTLSWYSIRRSRTVLGTGLAAGQLGFQGLYLQTLNPNRLQDLHLPPRGGQILSPIRSQELRSPA